MQEKNHERERERRGDGGRGEKTPESNNDTLNGCFFCCARSHLEHDMQCSLF